MVNRHYFSCFFLRESAPLASILISLANLFCQSSPTNSSKSAISPQRSSPFPRRTFISLVYAANRTKTAALRSGLKSACIHRERLPAFFALLVYQTCFFQSFPSFIVAVSRAIVIRPRLQLRARYAKRFPAVNAFSICGFQKANFGALSRTEMPRRAPENIKSKKKSLAAYSAIRLNPICSILCSAFTRATGLFFDAARLKFFRADHADSTYHSFTPSPFFGALYRTANLCLALPWASPKLCSADDAVFYFTRNAAQRSRCTLTRASDPFRSYMRSLSKSLSTDLACQLDQHVCKQYFSYAKGVQA